MKTTIFKHPKKRHGAYVRWQVFALTMAFALCWSVPLGMAAAPVAYEGSGQPSPEDAARAYLEGVRNGDLYQTLAVFAIESYVERYDFRGLLEKLKAYLPSRPISLPNANPMFQAINVERRKAEVVSGISYHLLAFRMPDMEPNKPLMFNDEGEAAEFVSGLEANTGPLALSSIQIGEAVAPETLSDMYADEKNLENLDWQRQTIGADEMRSVVLVFSVDTKAYLFCCDVAKYGEAWYLVSLGGNMGNLLGISAANGGIMPMH